MTSEQLHEAMNELDDELIEEAETIRSKPRKLPRRAAYGIAAAACFCVLSVALLVMQMHRLLQPLDKELTGESNHNTTVNTELGTETTVTEPYLDSDNGIGTTTVQAGEATDVNMATTTKKVPHTIGTSGSANLIERPTAIVRITSWDDNGFRGVVIRGEDTDAVAAGEVVTVRFLETTGFEVTTNQVVAYYNRLPTEEELPVDTEVQVRFVRMQTEDQMVLYAESVGIKAVIE